MTAPVVELRTSEEARREPLRTTHGPPAWYRRAFVAVGVVTLLIGAHALAATPPTIGIKEFKYGPPLSASPWARR